MDVLDLTPLRECDERTYYVAEYPVDFAAWLQIAEELDTELVQGVIVEKMAAQYPHEWIYVWLLSILRPFTSHRALGTLLGSRTAIKISNYSGRLPDLLFVRADNRDIIRDDAIYGVPDLVIEIVSSNDRRGALVALETDYRTLGIPEIVFIDPKKKRVRRITKTEGGYEETFHTTGRLEFACIPGFWIKTEWLFADTKPDEFTHTSRLLAGETTEEAEDLPQA